MKTILAALTCEMAFACGDKPMVFDWDTAARLIKERKPKEAYAGLSQDWEWTGGIIYADGSPNTSSYTFLASNHAKPELYMDGDIVPCFCFQEDHPEWTSSTKWPASALAILADGGAVR